MADIEKLRRVFRLLYVLGLGGGGGLHDIVINFFEVVRNITGKTGCIFSDESTEEYCMIYIAIDCHSQKLLE